MTETTNEEKEKFIEKIKENRSKYLVLGQVHPLIFQRFKEIANEMYEGHYGFTLKYLLDIHDGICKSNHEEIYMALEEITSKIAMLETRITNTKPKDEKKIRTNLKGQEVKLI
jgi:hypothetical protein